MGDLLIAVPGLIGLKRRRLLVLIVLAMGGVSASASAAPVPAPNVNFCPSGTTTTKVEFSVVVATGCFKEEGNTYTNTNPTPTHTQPVATLNGLTVGPLYSDGKLQIRLTKPAKGAPPVGHVFVSGGLCDPKPAVRCDGSSVPGSGGIPFLPRRGANFDVGPPPVKPGDDVPIFKIPPPVNGTKWLGFPIGGEFVAALGKDKDGTPFWKFTANLMLPEVFKTSPSATAAQNGAKETSATLTFTFGERIDATGTHIDGKAEIKDAYVGPLFIKGICVSYTSGGATSKPCVFKVGEEKFLNCAPPVTGANRWDAVLNMELPTPKRVGIALFGGFGDGKFLYGGAQARNLGIQVSPAFKLDSFSGGLCLNPPPWSVTAGVGMVLGDPKLAAFKLDGTLTYKNSSPPELRVAANLESMLAGKPPLPIGNGFISYIFGRAFELGVDVAFYFPRERNKSILSLTGGVRGWIEAGKLDAFANGSVCVVNLACAGGEVALSTKGVGGCLKLAGLPYPALERAPRTRSGFRWVIRYKEIRGGAGYIWRGPFSLMGASCDVGPYRETRPKHADIALAAGNSESLTVRPGLPAVTIRAKGASGPPNIELIEPGGVTIKAPNVPAEIRPGELMFAKDPLDSTTTYTIVAPRAGVWEVKDLPGERITNVEQANGELPPSVLGGVSQLRGDRYVRAFAYAYTPDPDHTITFEERGPAGVAQELGLAKGQPCRGLNPEPRTQFGSPPGPRCGQITFQPAEGPAGKREIVAILSERGIPIDEQRVASYNAPPPARPAAIKRLMIRRQGTTITVHWNQAARRGSDVGPTAVYDVQLTSGDGARLLDVVDRRHTAATFGSVDTLSPVTVTVTALRDSEQPGKSESATLRVGKTSAMANRTG